MTERWDDLSITTMERKGTTRPWSYFLIRSVTQAVSWTAAHDISQPPLQVRAQDILRLDRGRESRLDSAGRAAVVGVSLLSRSLSLTSILSIVCANHSNSLTDALCVPGIVCRVPLH